MARSRRAPGERLIFLLLLAALATEATGTGAFYVQLVNVTNFTRLRVVHGADNCPGIEDVRWRLGSPLVDGNTAPIINESALVWSGLVLDRPGLYRVCACIAGEDADPSACDSRAAYTYDAGTFAVAGPTGAGANGGGSVPLGVGGSGTGKFFLEIDGARLSATDKFLAVERSQTCGELGDPSTGWRAASSGVFMGSQFLLEGSTDVAFGNLIASDVVVTEEFKLTFSITPRSSGASQPLDVLVFRQGTDPEVGWGEPAFDDTLVLGVRLQPDYSLSVYLDHPGCQSLENCAVTCNLGLVANRQKDIEVRLTNQTLLVSERSNSFLPCSLGNYSRRRPSEYLEVWAIDNYTDFADAQLSDIEYRAMTLDGLERDVIDDDFSTENNQVWTKSNANFVSWSQGRVVFSASAYLQWNRYLSRRMQTVVKVSFDKTDTCENHFVTLSTSPSLAKATSLKFGWDCDTKEVTTPTQTVTAACPGRSHYELTITLEPDGTAVYEDDSDCSTLVIHAGLRGVSGQDIYVFLGAVPATSASFDDVLVTVSEPLLLPARKGEYNQRSLNWTGLSLDGMESGSFRTCWCSQGEVEVLSRELAIPAPATSTFTTTSTYTPTTTPGTTITRAATTVTATTSTYTASTTPGTTITRAATTVTATTSTYTLGSRRLSPDGGVVTTTLPQVGIAPQVVTLSAGFFYNLTGRQLVGSGGSSPSSITPWNVGYNLQWSSTGATEYTIYAHTSADLQDTAARTLLDNLDANQTAYQLPPADPLANYSKVSVWASGAIVGHSSLHRYQNYYSARSAGIPELHDSDLRDGVVGGRVRWGATDDPSFSGYSVWLSEDEQGYKRTYLVDELNQPCRVPRNRRPSVDLPQNGVAIGKARYLIVYVCNKAGEMHIGSAVGLVDRYTPNPVGCTKFEDFKTEAGVFTVGSTGVELVNGATGYGRLKAAVGSFLLQIQGGEVLDTDRINIVASRQQCGGPGASLPNANVTLTEVGNFPREHRRLWNVTVNASGTYRVCACLLAGVCDSTTYLAFPENTFSVTTLSARIGTPWGGPPLDGIPFSVWVTGSHLDRRDRIQVVNDTVQCGRPGANESALDDPGAVGVSGNASRDSRGNTVLRWAGLNVQAGRGYRVCWCGALGPRCTTAEAFGTEVGAFYVDLTPTNTSTTTTTMTSTTSTTTTSSTTSTTTISSTTSTTSTTTTSITTSTTTTSTTTTSTTATSTTTTSTTTSTTSLTTTTITTTVTSTTITTTLTTTTSTTTLTTTTITTTVTSTTITTTLTTTTSTTSLTTTTITTTVTSTTSTTTTSTTLTSTTTTSTTLTFTTTTSTTHTTTTTKTTTTTTTSTISTSTTTTSATNTTTSTTSTYTNTTTLTTTSTTTSTTELSGRVMTFSMIFDVDFLDLDLLFGLPPEEVLSYEWALLNQQLLAEAIAAVCGLPRNDALVLQVSPAFGGGDPGSGGDPGFGGDPGSGGYSFFAFRLDVLLVLPALNYTELGLAPNATDQQVADATARADAALSHSLMEKVLGPSWAGGGLNSTTGGWHIFDELKSMITAQGGTPPGGLAGGHGYTAVPPSVLYDYVLPVTTTATYTTTTTLQPCLTVPRRPANSTGSYDHCVPMDHLHECEVTCSRGFRVNGVLQCQEGTIVEVPSPACAIKYCPAPTEYGVPVLLPDGSALVGSGVNRTDLAMLNCSGLVYSSVCEAVCKPGFVLDPPTGGKNLFCDEEGNYSVNATFQGNATCVPLGQAESLRCHGETPVYPGVEPPFGCKGLYHGQTCSLLCKKGYSLENAGAIVCNRGTLEPDTGQTPTCTPSSCETPPIVLNGGDHANCSGLPHGASCVPRCLPGYTMIEGGITCEYGDFRVTGKCVEDFLAEIVVNEQAAAASGQPVESLILVADGAEFDLDIVVSEAQVGQIVENAGVTNSAPERFDYFWATGNTGLILEAIGFILELQPSLIDMELFPLFAELSGGLRRLDVDEWEPRELQALPTANPGNGSFRMRLRFMLPILTTTTMTTTVSVAQAAQIPKSAEEEFIEYLLTKFLGPAYVGSGTDASTNGTGAGSYAPGLFTAINQQLQAQNRTLPVGLMSSSVASNTEPVFVQNLALLKPKWVTDVWGKCSCSGGPMVETRSVICTVAHTPSCDAIETKPIDTQPCICPTPPPPIPWLGIADETKAAVGGGGLIGMFCIGFCCCEMRRFCKSTKKGKKKFADHNNVSASYIVQDPRKAETPDGKVHVIWDVSDEKVQVLLNKTKVQPSEVNPDLTGDAEDGEQAQAAGVERENTIDTALPMGGDEGGEVLLQQMLDEAKPMYQDGERVEYFSKTHQCWLPGEVKLSLYQTDTGALAKYDVHIGRGNQWRSDVAIDAIRLPLMQADPVEIFSKRGGGKWVPAAICGVQVSGATSLGYRVQLDESVEGFDNLRSSPTSPTNAPPPPLESRDSWMLSSDQLLRISGVVPTAAESNAPAPEVEPGGQILQKVPAIRLRRLFPEGCPVEVYRGPPRGWVPAIVSSRRGAETRYPEPLSQFSPGNADGAAAARRQSAATAASSSSYPSASQTQQLMRPWVMVPIQEDSPSDLFDDDGPVDLVASYLLRLRTLYVVSGHGTQDRLLLL